MGGHPGGGKYCCRGEIHGIWNRMDVIGAHRAQLAIAPRRGCPDYPKVSITLTKAGKLGIAADRVQGGVGNHAVASLYMTDPAPTSTTVPARSMPATWEARNPAG